MDLEKFLNIKIDRIYVINLISRKDRLELMDKEFKTKIKQQPMFTFFLKDEEKPRRGCMHSHICCIKDAIENNFENIMICEDDLIFDIELMKIIKNVNFPKDFDMIYLGYNLLDGKKIDNHIIKINSSISNYAYILNKQVFKYILDNIYEDWTTLPEWSLRNYYEKQIKFDEPYAQDLFFAKWINQHRKKSYGIYPMVCLPRPNFSDLENRDVNYLGIDIKSKNIIEA